ncbi:MAG TPA: PAS domain S-box protein [Thermoplasmata archaeon]|nr:PAS domain S-box protein [Thermoplasmata archaeon]
MGDRCVEAVHGAHEGHVRGAGHGGQGDPHQSLGWRGPWPGALRDHRTRLVRDLPAVAHAGEGEIDLRRNDGGNVGDGGAVRDADHHRRRFREDVLLRVAPLTDTTGAISGVIGSGEDVTEGLRAERALEHRNLVLRAIRNVNQLIIREKNRDHLITSVCEILASMGYHGAWIGLIDPEGSLQAAAESGMGDAFSTLVERMRGGEIPSCASRALETGDAVEIEDPAVECGDCPVAVVDGRKSVLAMRLESEGQVRGVLVVSLPREFHRNPEETSLVLEVAGDIAFALRSIEIEEEKRRIEEDIFVSEAQLRAIFDSSEEIIFMKDLEGRYVQANEAFSRAFDLPLDRIVGSRDRDLFPEDEAAMIEEIDREILSSGRAHKSEDVLTVRGEVRIYRTTKVPIRDSRGEIIGLCGFADDNTEMRRAMDKLRESEERFRSLFEDSGEGIYFTTREGEIIDINPAGLALFGLDPDEISGINVNDLYLDPEVRCRFQEEIEARGFVKDFEVRFRRRDGQVIDCLLTSSVRTDADGNVIGYQGIIHDVTERRQVQAALEESLREKELLLREIHHRVKNNMQIICSMMRLQAGCIEDEELVDKMLATEQRIRSMAMVHDRLYQSSDLARIDLLEYLERLGQGVHRTFCPEEGGIRLEVEGDGVLLDITRAVPCGLILNELLTNSFKHAFPDGRPGTVRVDLRKDDDRVIVTVADDGVGIPEDVDPYTTGTLGMELIRTLVEQLDGRMDIDGTSGTRITIEFRAG